MEWVTGVFERLFVRRDLLYVYVYRRVCSHVRSTDSRFLILFLLSSCSVRDAIVVPPECSYALEKGPVLLVCDSLNLRGGGGGGRGKEGGGRGKEQMSRRGKEQTSRPEEETREREDKANK